MAETFEQAITEIKQRADIGAVIGRSVKLKRSGRSLVGLCPFHNEKSPSFYVHPTEGFFKCFGCDAKGDVFSFLERSTGQNFIDIARSLADEFGVEIPDDRRSTQDKERSRDRDRAMRAADLSQLYFRQCLRTDEGKPGLHYLKTVRGLSDEEIDRWAIGYGGTSPEGLFEFLKSHDVTLLDARNAGVVASGKHGEYSFYRTRVTFPIRNRAGKVLAFGGRALGDRGPKYVNGPQSLIYDKSRDLYGLFEALPELKKGRAGVLVEGYFDVVALGRANYAAGLSPCGTSLTPRHIQTIERFTDRVVLCLDSDSAGMKGTERALLMLLQADMKVSLAELLHKDPDDYIQADQADGLLRTLESAKDAFEALVDRAVDKSAGSPQRRLRAVEALLPFLAAPKDALTRSHYLRYVADNLRSEIDILREAVETKGKIALAKLTRGTSPQRRPSSPATTPAPRPNSTPPSRSQKQPNAQPAGNQTPAKTSPNEAARGSSNKSEAFDGDDLPHLSEPTAEVWDESLLREAREFESGGTPLPTSLPTASKASAKTSLNTSSNENEDESEGERGAARDDDKEGKRAIERPSDVVKPQSPPEDGHHLSGGEERFDSDIDHDSGAILEASRTEPRAPASWKTAERAMARALLSHPHLAHKAAILVPALRNWELSIFISQLDHLVIAHPSENGMDALSRVQIPDRGVFPQLLREIFISRGNDDGGAFMTEDAAVRFIEDFVQTLDEVEVRGALGEVQRAMLNADERNDHDTWKRLQEQQQELIRLLRDVSAGLHSSPTPPTPSSLKQQPRQLGPPDLDTALETPPKDDAPILQTPAKLGPAAEPDAALESTTADDENMDDDDIFDF